MGIRQFMFDVGSLGVAIGAVLLFVSVLAILFLGRELSGTERYIAVVGSCVIGIVLWVAIQGKLGKR